LHIDFMALTMIDPASSWFEIAELPAITQLRRQTVNGKELLTTNKIFDKTLDCIAKLVNKTWLSRYQLCHCLIYNNGSEFKLHFEYLCKSYGIKHKPKTVKNLQANGILELVHQDLGQILRTAEIDMADSVTPDVINVFLDIDLRPTGLAPLLPDSATPLWPYCGKTQQSKRPLSVQTVLCVG
jgi:hypothetical protein